MTQSTSAEIPETTTKSNQRLAILLAMAMFVLGVEIDWELINASLTGEVS